VRKRCDNIVIEDGGKACKPRRVVTCEKLKNARKHSPLIPPAKHTALQALRFLLLRTV
jgi:hypothetical protein